MPEGLVTRLQAMYHSGQVSSFIISSLPVGELSIGWIEQGLLGKGFKGNMQDKEIQENLIIPTDRFIRLILETEPTYSHGLFILGNHIDSKLVVYLGPLTKSGKTSQTAVGFNASGIRASELINVVGQILVGRYDSINGDTNLDYIEQLISDSASGNVSNLLSLSLPPSKSTPTTWIKKILKTDLTSKDILAKSGNPLEISPPIPLLTRWLVGLDIFKRTENAISSLLLIRHADTLVYLWDSNLKVATFATVGGLSLEHILNSYLFPLWFIPTEISKIGPEVIIEETRSSSRKIYKPPESIVTDSRSISIVRTRLEDLVSRMSSLISIINNNNTRLTKLLKNGRSDVVDELSYDAIDELRRMEEDTKVIASISAKLQKLEEEFERGDISLDPDELQQIVTKMNCLRTILDKIEIALGTLDTKASEIESLNFKRRTES